MRKNFLSALITALMSLSLIICSSIPALADDSSVNLLILADQIIQTNTYEDENSNIMTDYTDIDLYIDQVHEQFPDISDYELAISIYEYTGQEYAGLPESIILDILDLNNISTTSTYITVDQNGTSQTYSSDAVPYAVWNSSDGYMKITTNYSLLSTSGSEKHYQVWAIANWIKYPAMALQDAFVLGTNGTFDDSYEEFASVNQTFKCTVGCQYPYTYLNRGVSPTSLTDGDLQLEYKNYVPVIHFIPYSPKCSNCQGPASDEFFMAYIRYGVVTNKSVNIQAGYAHKTLGIGDISVGIDATGLPSFSISPAGLISEYIARPVTIQY